jgi:hypothetical protein
MRWADFEASAPEIARAGVERFKRSRLALLGTLRRDGWPRISPVEPLFMGTDLVLGMIWKSKKALDLLRDPRCVLHSVVSDPDANEGEFKLRGRAVATMEEQPAALVRRTWQVAASVPLHVFWIDIIGASLTTYDLNQGRLYNQRWDAATGVVRETRRYP